MKTGGDVHPGNRLHFGSYSLRKHVEGSLNGTRHQFNQIFLVDGVAGMQITTSRQLASGLKESSLGGQDMAVIGNQAKSSGQSRAGFRWALMILGAVSCGLLPAIKAEAQGQKPTAEQLLKRYKPSQKDVEYDTPDAGEMAKCSVTL